MWDALTQSGGMFVYLIIGSIGLLFLTVSFFFGELSEMFEFEGEIEADLEADLDADAGGPGFFSLRVLSVLLTTFGGISALGVYRGFGLYLSPLIGLAGGILAGSLVYYFGKLLYSQQSSSLIKSDDLIGCEAEVIVGIPAEGVGQVRCVIGESLIDKIARARDSQAIPLHSRVMIEGVTSGYVTVSRQPAHDGYRSIFSTSGDSEPSR